MKPVLTEIFGSPRPEWQIEDEWPLCTFENGTAVMAVADGMGGAGSTRHLNAGDPDVPYVTGAKLASILALDIVRDVLVGPETGSVEVARVLEEKANVVFDLFSASLESSGTGLRGNLSRPLPTTFAAAKITDSNMEIYWAGDSRVYVLSPEGLCLCTMDDRKTAGDSWDYLENDPPLSNYLGYRSGAKINHHSIELNEPYLVLVVTDGCYSFLQAPQLLEVMILGALVESTSIYAFSKRLEDELRARAIDDFSGSLCLASNESFSILQRALIPRREELQDQMNDAGEDRELLLRWWQSYGKDHERLLLDEETQ